MTESSEPEKKKASPERRDERIRPWNTLTPFSSESKKVFGFRGTGQIDLFLVSTKLPHTHTTPRLFLLSFVFCLLFRTQLTSSLSLSLFLKLSLFLSLFLPLNGPASEISPEFRPSLVGSFGFFFFFFTTPNFSGRGNSLFKN
jgi:hypothetical protein